MCVVNNIKKTILLFISFSFLLSSCRKFIEIEPPVTSINGKNVFLDDATAIAAVTGIYTRMSNSNFTLNLSLYPELSADNLSLFDLKTLNHTVYYQNSLMPSLDESVIQFWANLYSYIYLDNAAIEGLNESSGLTGQVKQQLLGETYFLRAFYYFYLVNLFGKAPLALSTDYKLNNSLIRADTSLIYNQIVTDLDQAKELLNDKYLDGDLKTETADRIRPNKMAACALLARVKLFMKNYADAETISSELINQTALYSSDINIDDVFLKNSLETIWAIKPVKANINTDEGSFFIVPSAGTGDPAATNYVYLSEDLMQTFEEGDKRDNIWIDSAGVYPYPVKYKVGQNNAVVTEYAIVFRLGEQYLIRAEARAEQNNITGAQEDLNIIRRRAGLGNSMASDLSALRAAILRERRVELFTEWGHRWLDIKRMGVTNDIMEPYASVKGGEWKPYKALYPISSTEIQQNHNLTQTPGYSN
jgi:starch-binding outer membrane protein, SusD/RagB family